MAGLGFAIGGALQGLGAGLAQQGASDAAARREMALEAARSANKRMEQQSAYDLGEQSADKALERSKQLATHTSGLRVGEGGIAAENQIKIDTAKTVNDLKLKTLDFKNQQTLERLKGAITRENSAAAAKLQQELNAGDIQRTFEAANGEVWTMRVDGRIQSTGVFMAPKASESTGGWPPKTGDSTKQPESPKTKPGEKRVGRSADEQKPTIIRFDGQGSRIK